MAALQSNTIIIGPVSRGLDDGVWASFKVLFDPNTSPSEVLIVQISLFSSENLSQHCDLARAGSDLCSESILIVVSGIAVHNLRDLGSE